MKNFLKALRLLGIPIWIAFFAFGKSKEFYEFGWMIVMALAVLPFGALQIWFPKDKNE